MDFKEYIKQYRSDNHLTQTEFAKKVGVTKATVSRWEKGSLTLSSKRILELCQVMNLPPNKIFDNSTSDESNDYHIPKMYKTYNVGFNYLFKSIHDLKTFVSFINMARELRRIYNKKMSGIIMTIDRDMLKDVDAIKSGILIINHFLDKSNDLMLRGFVDKNTHDMKIENKSVKQVIPIINIWNTLYIVDVIIELEGKEHHLNFQVEIDD